MSALRSHLFGIALALSASVTWAQDDALPNPPWDGGLANGADLYKNHCAICHGLDARGHGPLAAAMKLVPADLTQIATKHGGEFPDAKIADIIRNGGALLGHGSRAMMPWGLYFSERHKPEVGRARIKALVAYIKSLQEKPQP
jgi:mono/diheme cytochrome c family protein